MNADVKDFLGNFHVGDCLQGKDKTIVVILEMWVESVTLTAKVKYFTKVKYFYATADNRQGIEVNPADALAGFLAEEE